MNYVLYRLNEDYVCDSSLVIIDTDIKDKNIINELIKSFFIEYSLAFAVENYNSVDLDIVDVYKVEGSSFLNYLNLMEVYQKELRKYENARHDFSDVEWNEKHRIEKLIKEEIESLDSKIYLRIPVAEYSTYSDSDKSKIIEKGYKQISKKSGNIRFVSINKDLIESSSNKRVNNLRLVIKDLELKIDEKYKIFDSSNIKPVKPEYTFEKINK